MPNRLAGERSPYLLQHALNPVDWYPWSDAALHRARELDRPILLSIGYSACHWCHVMAHESFENEAIARFMNEHFINVKVDREERPDLDHIYQTICQLVTRQGGWPLTVVLTPGGRPFFVGTYFPPQRRLGRPGLPEVLEQIDEAWTTRRAQVERVAHAWTQAIVKAQVLPATQTHTTDPLIVHGERSLAEGFDMATGGFGGAPKFPSPVSLAFLLRAYEAGGGEHDLAMVERSLTAMASGGIHDQLGGGFHRYSVDANWQVPHFEKMLSDNALLAGLYLDVFALTGQERCRRVAEATLDYLDRELRTPAGGLASSQDADSEGEEGRYYTFTAAEVLAAVGPQDAALLCRALGVDDPSTPLGERSVLREAVAPCVLAVERGEGVDEVARRIAAGKAQLIAARNLRVPPGRDDKVITAWNALAVSAFAAGARVLASPRYEHAARALADFLLERLVDSDARVLRCHREGIAPIPGYLEDYAFLAAALVDLYTVTLEPRYLATALRLAAALRERFADPAGGPFFMTDGSEQLLERPRDLTDQATPSGTGVALQTLLRLDPYTPVDLAGPARAMLRGLEPLMRASPWATASMYLALDLAELGNVEVTLVAPPGDATVARWHGRLLRRHLPRLVLSVVSGPGDAPIAAGKEMRAGQPTAYVCAGGTCSPPLVRWVDIEQRLAAGPGAQGV